MYDGRIGRWLTTDPKGQYASPYEGMGNNPVIRTDPDGGTDCDGCKTIKPTAPDVASNTLLPGNVNITAQKMSPGEVYHDRVWRGVTGDALYAGNMGSQIRAYEAEMLAAKRKMDKWADPGNLVLEAAKFYAGGEIFEGGLALGKLGLAARGTRLGKVFWSGGEDALNAATNYAQATGGTTLEMTTGGKIMTTLNPILPRSISTPIWKSLSEGFASGAEGSVDVFHNVNGIRVESIWATSEYGILKQNQVNIIYHNVFP